MTSPIRSNTRSSRMSLLPMTRTATPTTAAAAVFTTAVGLVASFVFVQSYSSLSSSSIHKLPSSSIYRRTTSTSSTACCGSSSNSKNNRNPRPTSIPSASSTSKSETHRLQQTAADRYYRTHQHLPRPTTMHAVLPPMTIHNNKGDKSKNNQNIFVIGDVHGCYEELQLLIQTAIREHNAGRPFAAIILVGDLCNKGPQSAQVIRWARKGNTAEEKEEDTATRVFAVRGNHDDGALLAALGHTKNRAKAKYAWVLEGEKKEERQPTTTTTSVQLQHPKTKEQDAMVLSDEDVTWLSELPYTLTIPGAYLEQHEDVVIVHAGLIPNIPLHEQTIPTMVTLRDIIPVRSKTTTTTTTTTTTNSCNSNHDKDDTTVPSSPAHQQQQAYEMYEKKKKKNKNKDQEETEDSGPPPQAWAATWTGPQQIIFGHDAKRGLQTQQSPWTVGLDTGAVYGNTLTGIILPARTLVSIPVQKIYCPH